jgi:hypothetical protein
LTGVLDVLERWGAERDWLGPDPYEAMNSPLLARLARTPLQRRIAIQLVKRSPLDLRRPLRIAPRHNAASIAHLLGAYARLDRLGRPGAAERAGWAFEQLRGLRRPGFEGAGWSYHFDVETRFFFYSAQTPNTIATAFAGLALLDAHELGGGAELLELAEQAGRFFLAEVPLTETADGAYFGYLPGDRSPIHNASLLAAALLAELHRRRPVAELAAAVTGAARYALAHQRPDGSWPYAETPSGAWVDNFHTGYVLDALARIERSMAEHDPALAEAVGAARRRGLRFYAERLFSPDGAPRWQPGAALPIDSQNVAQAITSFVVAAEAGRPEWLDAAWRVFAFGRRRMRRRDGAFAFQRGRLWVNRTPHIRWVEAPMLDALARLALASGTGTGAAAGRGRG